MNKKQYVSPQSKAWQVRGKENLMDYSATTTPFRTSKGYWDDPEVKEEESDVTISIWDLY